MPFARKLVLNQWMLGRFGVKRFEALAEFLRAESLEGLDENNVHRFHHALTAQLFNLTQISTDQLLAYDQNIVAVTRRLNEHRITRGEEAIVWKYFQYLTLLFTEVYLDAYFRDAPGLLRDLNAHIAIFNEGVPEADRVKPFDETEEAWPQLNKLAFWSATGSGKTLLMHANILQYQRYLESHGRRRELNRILLLTPNEGLSRQHLREFAVAGIHAELFDKDSRGLFAGQAVEILDIHKLKDEMGEKTVAVEAFEGCNLVLIDEGHRGASGGEEGAWMRYRNLLCEKGFSFEYSATFGQAVKGDAALTDLYAKNILFDYSYKWFHGDGFGKEYLILNLDEETQNAHLEAYLVACLLAFHQQVRLHRERGTALRPFNLDKPLWIFVGGSVTASLATKEASDIVEILKFLARYVANRAASVAHIDRVLNRGLINAQGKNQFQGRFAHLNTSGLSPAQIFEESLSLLFNAPSGGALHVENLKGAPGEIALRIGDNEPFGVINVGDDAKLVTLCEGRPGLVTGERDFTGSLFHRINETGSPINVLIGAKKFTEGWNSWRVGTMGLMNVGKKEGSQIIQLFGRGVRLKGYGHSLKRSKRAELPAGVERPKDLDQLETLNIFGIHADYMAQFREFLKEEGLPELDDRMEFFLPVIRNLGTQRLKTIRLKKTINGVSTEFGDAFRKLGPVPSVRPPDPARETSSEYLVRNPVTVNWYPKIDALRDRTPGPPTPTSVSETRLHQGWLQAQHVAFLDVDRLFTELQQFKAERGWHNLNLSREGIHDLLGTTNWYRLYIPEEVLAAASFHHVRLWQEIASVLLKKYVERYYTFRKREWEMPHLEYQDLTEEDGNFQGVKDAPDGGFYRILIEQSQEEIVAKLTELKAAILKGDLKPWEFQGIKAVWFGQHLYQPLLHVEGAAVEISPVPLNTGEKRFVEDLKAYHDRHPGQFRERELYLLRNLSKGRGIGFFEAGNFHPDFILWGVNKADGHQNITFVDPKGVRHLSPDDPKIRFHTTIKDIETRLADPKVRLESFILSNTPAHEMTLYWGLSESELAQRHVLFQEGDPDQLFSTLLLG